MEVWEPGATIRLYRVPWDSGYANVVQWGTTAERDAYFDSLDAYAIDVGKSVFCYPGEPLTLDVPFTTAYLYNYLVVENPVRPTSPESPSTRFHYFITSTVQQAPQPTTVSLQLDVWTQFLHQISFGTGYLEQGHLPMVNAPALDASNIPATLLRYYSVDEGLDNGPVLVPYREESYTLQADADGVLHPDALIVVSTASLTEDPGTIDKPNLVTSRGGFTGGVFSGSAVYVIRAEAGRTSVESFLRALASFPWVAQCIVSITSVPFSLVDGLVDETSGTAMFAGKVTGDTPDLFRLKPNGKTASDSTAIGAIDFAHVAEEGWDGVETYKDLWKLWSFPYSAVEIGNGQNSIVLRPELLPANETELRVFACAVAPYFEAAAVPWGYGCPKPGTFTVSAAMPPGDSGEMETVSVALPFGDLLDSAVWFDDFPQWSILNNSAVVYMASTAHARAYGYTSADYAFERGQRSADLSRRQWYRGAAASGQNYIDSSNLSALSTVLGNLRTPLAGVAGMAGNFVNRENFFRTMAAGQRNADENFDLASWVNSQDYSMAIQSIEAGVADAQLRPPSAAGNSGGQGLRYVNALSYSVVVRYLRMVPAYVAKVGDHFKRFGYRVGRWVSVPQDLRVCKPFSFWKFADVELECAQANETERDAIRGILSKGVTVWGDPSRIGRALPVEMAPDPSKTATYYV